ncbi:nuclear transport factor 2 family protein [Pseudonocardia sp. MH-G8]|uniref:nuclear transport factor 2 family protein n=1 Tax=Pseudonocardia sp. MH-G8 TaxID=1854588 RepID=UPI000B9F9B35|nr:nuclear transport factor 2 family protein [Pseudonocardia sp. MH-G8]OZM75793.1 isomerase [Pseudonocardia sp. MH-G8]
MSSTSVVERRTPAQHALAEHLRLIPSGRTREWLDLFTADGVLEFPYAPTGMPRELRGHEALLAHMTHFPEIFDVQFVDLVFHDTVDATRAIAEFRATGRAVATGKPYEQTCISVVYTDDAGRITRYVDYWNPLAAVEALDPADNTSRADITGTFGS